MRNPSQNGTDVQAVTENKAVLNGGTGTEVTLSLVRQVQTSSPTASFVTRIDLKHTQRGEKEMRKQKGFSLIELLIVVAIILIIAAIAIPNLLRARMAANESSAVGSVRTLNTAEISYNTTYPTIGFQQTLAYLGAPVGGCTPSSSSACLVDSVLGNNGIPSGSGKSGYSFSIVAGAAQAGGVYVQYDVNAIPLTENQTGIRSFCSVEDAVVRVQPTGAAPGAEANCAGLNPLNQ
jgi:type IV pilus assembly protein PilA